MPPQFDAVVIGSGISGRAPALLISRLVSWVDDLWCRAIGAGVRAPALLISRLVSWVDDLWCRAIGAGV
ncbi:hypothetical protein CKW46_08780 [Mycobacterium liflandii]|nr:hypothetical protein CKW46_08780 [Mycobacterium liflandii]